MKELTPGMEGLSRFSWRLVTPYEYGKVEVWEKGFSPKAYLKLFGSGLEASMDDPVAGKAKGSFWLTHLEVEYALMRMKEMLPEGAVLKKYVHSS